jgi:hypothetical protein
VIVGPAAAIRDATGQLLVVEEKYNRRHCGLPGGQDLERRAPGRID